MLAFLDLETTGLEADKEDILEVACIATDDKLAEVSRFYALVYPDKDFWELGEFVRDMHTKNGLWREASASGQMRYSVDCMLAEFFRTLVLLGKDDKGRTTIARPRLAGNSIHFDRGFLKRHLKNAEAELHYRMVDVSSVNELVERFNKPLFDARPRNQEAAHRAMADAEESLRVCRYYADRLGSILVPQPGPDADVAALPAGTVLVPQ